MAQTLYAVYPELSFGNEFLPGKTLAGWQRQVRYTNEADLDLLPKGPDPLYSTEENIELALMFRFTTVYVSTDLPFITTLTENLRGSGFPMLAFEVTPKGGLGGTLTDSLGGGKLEGSFLSENLKGLSGDDVVKGLGGYDRLFGGSGSDKLYGGDGNDTLLGQAGQDVAVGGDGNDTLKGGSGNDVLKGNDDDDRLSGNGGKDKLIGGAGSDLLEGGGGNDRLKGGHDDDLLRGDAGRDRLDGGWGNDTLEGGAGNDVLSGKRGKNFLWGGEGSDTFVLIGYGSYVQDFTAGEDVIDVRRLGPSTRDDYSVKISMNEVVLYSAGSDLMVFNNLGTNPEIETQLLDALMF